MKKTRIIKKCERCNRDFEVYLYSIRNGHGKFCSMKCRGKQGGRKKIFSNFDCLVCGNNFHVDPNQLKRGRGKYCSSVCYHKSTIGKTAYNKGIPMSKEQRLKVSESRRGKCLGKSNPSWKGGITPFNKIIRESVEYKLWREAVFKRDNFMCQECFMRGGKLHAHHIKPFSLFPELRLAIDNGITLCFECHKKTDSFLRNNNKSLARII